MSLVSVRLFMDKLAVKAIPERGLGGRGQYALERYLAASAGAKMDRSNARRRDLYNDLAVLPAEERLLVKDAPIYKAFMKENRRAFDDGFMAPPGTPQVLEPLDPAVANATIKQRLTQSGLTPRQALLERKLGVYTPKPSPLAGLVKAEAEIRASAVRRGNEIVKRLLKRVH